MSPIVVETSPCSSQWKEIPGADSCTNGPAVAARLPRSPPSGLWAGRRGVGCVVNLSAGPVSLPGGAEVRLASGPLDGGRLPADTAVWLRIQGGPAVPG